jgi:hypothetical protein
MPKVWLQCKDRTRREAENESNAACSQQEAIREARKIQSHGPVIMSTKGSSRFFFFSFFFLKKKRERERERVREKEPVDLIVK